MVKIILSKLQESCIFILLMRSVYEVEDRLIGLHPDMIIYVIKTNIT